MTRIGTYGVDFLRKQEKATKFINAEHREITRVCGKLEKRIEKNHFSDIPHRFLTVDYKHKLIRFHELFWLDKGLYTYKRYCELHDTLNDMKATGEIAAQNPATSWHSAWDIYKQKPEFYKDFTPEFWQIKVMELRVLQQGGHPVDFNDYIVWIPNARLTPEATVQQRHTKAALTITQNSQYGMIGKPVKDPKIKTGILMNPPQLPKISELANLCNERILGSSKECVLGKNQK